MVLKVALFFFLSLRVISYLVVTQPKDWRVKLIKNQLAWNFFPSWYQSFMRVENRRFSREALGTLAFDWVWGRGWPCFDQTSFVFLWKLCLKNTSLHMNSTHDLHMKAGRFVSKQGQLQPRLHLFVKWAMVL